MDRDYKKLYEAQAKGVEALQNEVNRLAEKVRELIMENERHKRHSVTQSDVIERTLNQRNKTINDVLEENKRLKEELRNLKNGD